MTGGSAIGARAPGDVARRDLPSEWGGPEPGAARGAARDVKMPGEPARRATVRKP